MYSPEDLIKFAKVFAKKSRFALLLSGSNYDSAKRSFLCLFPYKKVTVSLDQTVKDPWQSLKEQLGSFERPDTCLKWVGYLTYEMGAYHDLDVALTHGKNRYPDACFQRYTVILELHHETKKIKTYVDEEGLFCLTEEEKSWEHIFQQRSLWDRPSQSDACQKTYLLKDLEPVEEYRKKVMRAKESIFSGDIYQVNLSQNCRYGGDFNDFEIFCRLFNKNPAPFAAFLKVDERHSIISSSPERLLLRQGSTLETRPIKGTMKRGESLDQDEKNKRKLLQSEKDCAELLMITDLMRNDLGKISLPGTVKTKKIRTCEAYDNVFHLLSVICSKVASFAESVDVLRAVFPGGSITGCPKLRAMEIIHELEGVPRGIYTGSIGYFAYNGDFDFNICIRTLDIFDEIISARFGGAIVADSDPYQEYLETLDKGSSIFKILRNIL